MLSTYSEYIVTLQVTKGLIIAFQGDMKAWAMTAGGLAEFMENQVHQNELSPDHVQYYNARCLAGL